MFSSMCVCCTRKYLPITTILILHALRLLGYWISFGIVNEFLTGKADIVLASNHTQCLTGDFMTEVYRYRSTSDSDEQILPAGLQPVVPNNNVLSLPICFDLVSSLERNQGKHVRRQNEDQDKSLIVYEYSTLIKTTKGLPADNNSTQDQTWQIISDYRHAIDYIFYSQFGDIVIISLWISLFLLGTRGWLLYFASLVNFIGQVIFVVVYIIMKPSLFNLIIPSLNNQTFVVPGWTYQQNGGADPIFIYDSFSFPDQHCMVAVKIAFGFMFSGWALFMPSIYVIWKARRNADLLWFDDDEEDDYLLDKDQKSYF